MEPMLFFIKRKQLVNNNRLASLISKRRDEINFSNKTNGSRFQINTFIYISSSYGGYLQNIMHYVDST